MCVGMELRKMWRFNLGEEVGSHDCRSFKHIRAHMVASRGRSGKMRHSNAVTLYAHDGTHWPHVCKFRAQWDALIY